MIGLGTIHPTKTAMPSSPTTTKYWLAAPNASLIHSGPKRLRPAIKNTINASNEAASQRDKPTSRRNIITPGSISASMVAAPDSAAKPKNNAPYTSPSGKLENAYGMATKTNDNPSE